MNNNLSEILSVILMLQQNVDEGDNNLETCDRDFLGCCGNTQICNTRPVMLYTQVQNGTPWSMPTVRENVTCPTASECSSVFRIEKLDNNVATFRVLTQSEESPEGTVTYEATNSFFTMNLDFLFVLRCLPDTYVSL